MVATNVLTSDKYTASAARLILLPTEASIIYQ